MGSTGTGSSFRGLAPDPDPVSAPFGEPATRAGTVSLDVGSRVAARRRTVFPNETWPGGKPLDKLGRGIGGLSLSKDSNRDLGLSTLSPPLALPTSSQPAYFTLAIHAKRGFAGDGGKLVRL